MVTLFYANSAVVAAQVPLKKLYQDLPEAMQTRANNYLQTSDAYNFVLGRLLLQKGLQNLGLFEGWEAIYYNQQDKPLLPNCFFSIAHSNDWVACAICPEQAIGLDMELSRSQLARRHFRHCFDEQEWARIQSDASMHTFYTYWTQKEAILKATGLGLGHLLDIVIDVPTQTAYLKSNPAQIWHLKALKLGNFLVYTHLCLEDEVPVVLQDVSTTFL